MNTVLKTPELVDLILQNFWVTPSEYRRGLLQKSSRYISREDLVSDKEKRGTLYRMALTNRAMSQNSLPILWSTIDGLLPLFKLIPNLEYNEILKEWVLARPLCEDDLRRFDTFAAMVRHIDVPTRQNRTLPVHSAIHSSAVAEICKLRAACPLFPYLQTLSVEDAYEYATLFLTETLKRVHIDHASQALRQSDPPPRPAALNLLALLPTRTPLLEELHVGSTPSSSKFRDILQLKHLRKLTLDIDISRPSCPVDESARYQFFKDLECLPRLQDLNIGGLLLDLRDIRAPLLEPGLCSYAFPALESLTFQGDEGYLAKLLPRLYDTPTLKTLVFNHADWRDDDEEDDDGKDEEYGLKRAFSLLAKESFRSLTTLSVTRWDGIETFLDPTYLEPLLQISGMQHFLFQDVTCFGLTDDFVQKMASAWPQLETFCMRSPSNLSAVDDPTLAAVQIFARHCPKLRRLSLNLDHEIPPLNDPSRLHRLDQLRILSIYENAIIGKANVSAVARHISASFPALLLAFAGYCPGWDGEEESRDDDWRAVCRTLSVDRTPEELSILGSIFERELLS